MTNEELHLIKRALAAINTVGHLAQNDFNQFPIDAANERVLNILKESVERHIAWLQDAKTDIEKAIEKASK